MFDCVWWFKSKLLCVSACTHVILYVHLRVEVYITY